MAKEDGGTGGEADNNALEVDELHDKVEDDLGLGLLVDHDELVRGGVDLEGAVERDGRRDVVLRAWDANKRVGLAFIPRYLPRGLRLVK